MCRCVGTSSFLKDRFGIGYHMTMVKEAVCDTKVVEQVVTAHVSSAKVSESVINSFEKLNCDIVCEQRWG